MAVDTSEGYGDARDLAHQAKADIIEILNTAWVADALEAGHIRSTIVAERMIRERHAALAEIAKLRAERDAATRNMRERCAKVAESGDRQTEWPRVEGAQRRSPTANIQTAIAAAIRALPAIIATEGDNG